MRYIFLVYLYEAGHATIPIGAFTDETAARERVRRAKRERPHRSYGFETWAQRPGEAKYTFAADWRYDEADDSFYHAFAPATEEGPHANV